MSGAGLTSHCTPCPPPLPRPIQWAWARVGEGEQNLTKTKAACSNRLLPKGCHGNKGTRGTRRPS